MQKSATAEFAAPHSRQLNSRPMTPQIFAPVAIALVFAPMSVVGGCRQSV
jgi:hypothetical protein